MDGKCLVKLRFDCLLLDLPVKLLRILVPQEQHIRLSEHHQFKRSSRSLSGVLDIATHHCNALEILIAENRKRDSIGLYPQRGLGAVRQLTWAS